MNQDDVIQIAHMRKAVKDRQVKRIRETATLSQAEVADACGVSAAAVSRWESGDRVPRGTPARKYAELLSALIAITEPQE